jgi:hypothetical protein
LLALLEGATIVDINVLKVNKHEEFAVTNYTHQVICYYTHLALAGNYGYTLKG